MIGERELRRDAGARGSAGSGNMVAFGAADWLSFAAAPTFAIMAFVTGVSGSGLGRRERFSLLI
jgi:hypothetical protein